MGPRESRSRLRPWHRLVEHYTPDGPLGRLLLAAAAGSAGGFALLAAFWAVAVPVLLWPLVGLAASAVGLAGVALALVVLWPVYLSLIGNVESASAYPAGGATGLSGGTGAVGDIVSDADDPDEAVALLKRRYAAGEVSDEEFERRLDALLAVDGALDRPSRERDPATDRD